MAKVKKKRVAVKKRATRTAKKKAAKKVTKKAAKKVTKKKAAKKVTKKAARKVTKKKVARKVTKKKVVKKKVAKKKVAKKKPTKKNAAKKVTRKKAARKVAAKKVTKKKASRKRSKKKKVSKQETKEAVMITKKGIPTLDLEEFEVKRLTETGVEDAHVGSTRYAWLGSGQCGGRLAKSFYDLGYKKVMAANTTHHDLDLLEIPQEQKFLMDIGELGAGKDMGRGNEAVSRWRQEILHHFRQTFGTEVEHIMVCFGAGGGTGGGSAVELVNMAKDFARSVGKTNPSKCVGVLMTLPTLGEASSPQVAQNAYQVATEMGQLASEGQISPLIIIDNEKISKMYPGLTVKEFWPRINNTVSMLFDVFNRLSAMSSPYTSLDPVDYQSVVHSGGCTIMGVTKIAEYRDRFALSTAVKQNLAKTLLTDGFDLATAKAAGCAFVGGKDMMANVPSLQDNINYAFDVLADITGDATIHRGIYEDQRDSLRVYTMIGGLDFPTKRIEELLLSPAMV